VKVGRIIWIVLLLLLVLYLFLFHAANPVLLALPWLSLLIPPLPASYVVALALLVGFLIGWLPARLLAWRRGREVRRLSKRVAELEPVHAPVSVTDPYQPAEYPVIPDRGLHQGTGDVRSDADIRDDETGV